MNRRSGISPAGPCDGGGGYRPTYKRCVESGLAGQLNDEELERSSVVANSTMNRQRGIAGPNSYPEDLGFDPVRFLLDRLQTYADVRWLDLCCGTGRALIEASQLLDAAGVAAQTHLLGVDLVPMFNPVPPNAVNLRLLEASLATWKPEARFDLITCVHGLHYLGDKIGLICHAASWLDEDGLFAANLDPNNLRFTDGAPAGRSVISHLRQAGFEYQTRRHLLTRRGYVDLTLPFTYLAACDRAGPNYTGQPAVNSYYARQ